MTNDRGPTTFTVALVFVSLATAFTCMRIVSKWGITKKVNADDFLVIVGWCFTLAMGISVMVGAQNGLGKRDDHIQPEWLETLKRSIYAFTIFYNPALMATKSAILLLYLRMATADRFLKYASLFTLAIVNIAGVVLTFLNIFQCHPVAAAFSDTEGKCMDLVGLYLSSAPVNILTDLAILLLPLPLLTALRMEFRQKVVLVATFIVGGFVTIVDVVRIVYLQKALRAERAEGRKSGVSANERPPEFIYEVSFTLMWSTIEVSVGLICACVLVLKPLVMRIVPAMLHQETNEPEQGAQLELSKFPRSPTQRLTTVNEGPLPVPEGAEDEPTGPMDFMQMIAMDETPTQNQNQPTQTQMVQDPVDSSKNVARRFSKRSATIPIGTGRKGSLQVDVQQPTQNFFDFVNMKGKKPLTDLTAREAWWPVLFVSTLFFMWGFAYGLLGTLNGEIQLLMGFSPSRAIALHSAYWLAYFFGPPLIGYWTLTRASFQSTFIAGLVLYAIGAMAFWPSSVLLSYPGFFISNFIIASGLACLEVAANPFIALAGPSHLSEARLNFAQGIQAVGGVLSPLLAQKVLFANVNQASLFNIQWCYLAVALFVVALAVVFYYVPLSEAPDDELEAVSQQALLDVGLEPTASLQILGTHISARTALLTMGVFTMAIIVGAQETTSYWSPRISEYLSPQMDPVWTLAIAHALFALGRFIASFVTYMGVRPRYVLLVCTSGAFICSILSYALPRGRGVLAPCSMIYFFESAIFPTLFAITIRNQGSNTKFTSAALVTAISGGGVFPGVAYGADSAHLSVKRYSLVVVIVLYGLSIIMPAWLCGGMKTWVDPLRPRKNGDSRILAQFPSESTGSTEGKTTSAHVEVRDTGQKDKAQRVQV